MMSAMETIVTHGSPLAGYFEGEARGSGDLTARDEHTMDLPSFAPPKPLTFRSRIRNWIPSHYQYVRPLRRPLLPTRRLLNQIINGGLGRSQNSHFLEQFRYSIVASQLLDEQASHSQLPLTLNRAFSEQSSAGKHEKDIIDLTDGVIIAAGAFLLAWVVHWTRSAVSWSALLSRSVIALSFTLSVVVALVLYIKRQRHARQRHEAISLIRQFTTASSDLDRALSASISLIQEVETVSHGYRLSSPLPPVSRLDGISHKRHCARLRKTCDQALTEIIPSLSLACFNVRPLADNSDVERYHDVYGLSPADSQELELGLEPNRFEDQEGLKALRLSIYRLHTIRRLLLCCLLALEVDDGPQDFDHWEIVLQNLAVVGDTATKHCSLLLQRLEEQDSLTPLQTPKVPQRPGSERFRAQVRKLGSLSQGIRGLQAKMHILREEADRVLEVSDDQEEFEDALVTQYESLGKDIQCLLHEWETGTSMLSSNILRNDRRRSLRSPTPLSPLSPISGTTAVESSPRDSLPPNGVENKRMSLLSFSSAGESEEIFEAISLPRQRSPLTREERIVKMQEEREKAAAARERSHASSNMLRELESVINTKATRPRRKTDSRIAI